MMIAGGSLLSTGMSIQELYEVCEVDVLLLVCCGVTHHTALLGKLKAKALVEAHVTLSCGFQVQGHACMAP